MRRVLGHSSGRIGCVFLVFLSLFMSAPTQAQLAQLHGHQRIGKSTGGGQGASGDWVALVQTRTYSGADSEALGGSGKDISAEVRLNRNTVPSAIWSTAMATGNQSRVLSGIYVSTGSHVARLELRKTSRTLPKNRQGYKADLLVQEIYLAPVCPAATKLAVGPTNEDLEDIKGFESSAKEWLVAEGYGPPPNKTMATMEVYNRVLAIYGPWISIDSGRYSNFYSAAHPCSTTNGWKNYTLTDKGLTLSRRIPLPSAVEQRVTAGIPKTFLNADLAPEQVSRYGIALSPHGGGVLVEGGVGVCQGDQTNVQREVCVAYEQALPKGAETVRRAFVEKHPGLVNWSKTSFYTISPDGNAVVYAIEKDLYWRSINAKQPRKIAGDCSDIRGCQWVNSSDFCKGEQALLSSCKP